MSERSLSPRVEALLSDVGLIDVQYRKAQSLPYGHQRLLEVAMALALSPSLLILDEPTQGLAQSEIDALCERIRSIAREVTVLVIEHNMPVVLSLAQRVTVMDSGRIIAEGTPESIQENQAVQSAYLGR